MKFTAFLFCITLIGISLLPTNAFSETKDIQEKELNTLKKEIKKLQQHLQKKLKQQSKENAQLNATEKQIATATKILNSTIRQLKEKSAELVKLKRQKVKLENNKFTQKRAIAQQLKSAYINGKQEYLKLLLNQEDPEELGRTLVYYSYINKARTEKVVELQETLERLKTIEQSINKEINDLNLLKESKQKDTQRLIQLKDERKAIIIELTQEINTDNKKLEELEINQKELEKLIESVQKTIDNIDFSQPMEGIKHLKGKLNWPAKGKQIQKYGSRLAAGLKSNGVVIKAKEGDPVKAIHYGRVVYADWLRGFGLLLIVDHGKGYMSLYGYNQALYKQVGDWIEANEIIAIIGQSGGRQETALYFELRHKGKPFNPKRWVR